MTERAVDVISAAAVSIDHSRWSNRIAYLFSVTGVLALMLGGAMYLDKPTHIINTLSWLIVFFGFLTVVTPSAEQVLKMLNVVAAIRAGAKIGANSDQETH